MSDDKSEGGTGARVAIVVAIIGVVGTLGGAFFANIDKIFPRSPATDALPADRPAGTYPRNMKPLELHTNRDKGDFGPNPARTESAEACARLCGEAPNCKAMTFVSSPNGVPGGECWLKSVVPPATPRPDMTSAVKTSD
jgi:PAN domain